VWSFEPNPELAGFLTRVVAPNVHVESVALSDHSGTETLFAPREVGQDALASLSSANTDTGADRIEVPVRRLDDYRLEDVKFMKIDVEGHEFEVLKGAEETIGRCAPMLLIEIDQALHDQPVERIFNWLSARGYHGRVRRRRSWAPLSTFNVETDQSPLHNVKSSKYINDFVFTSWVPS
jgi:FkbM family methyltransferase